MTASRAAAAWSAVALGLDQVLGAEALVAILAAAQVEEVVGVRVERLAEPAGGQLEADPAPRAAALEHEQVAAVGVDVHQVRIERADAQETRLGEGGTTGERRELRHASITTVLATCSSVDAISRAGSGRSPAWEPSRSSSAALRTGELDHVALALLLTGGASLA